MTKYRMKWSEVTEAFKPSFDEETVIFRKPSIPGLEMFAGGYHPKQHIGWLEVVKTETGQGIGTQAVHAFEDWVKQQGGKEIRAEALAPSLEFWKKLGYDVASRPNHKNRFPISKRLS